MTTTDAVATEWTCPIPRAELEISARGFEQSVTLPGACYTDPEFFRFEMEAIYGHEWICVGRSDMVPNPGDYFTITVTGEPLIVVRDQDGAVQVMSAVCRHRGMVITAPGYATPEHWLDRPRESSGNCRNFQCPYHWWTYDLSGRLVGAPEMHRTPGFERRDWQLPKLSVELWKGFVFVNFDAEAPALAPRLAALDEYLANWHVEDMASVHPETIPGLPFNWKVMVENFMEGYHPDRLHKGIHDWAPSSRSMPP
jgi:phenylpropionate dioxygenase-like ring-hydroxylating dioxygenase large terminal subunit